MKKLTSLIAFLVLLVMISPAAFAETHSNSRDNRGGSHSDRRDDRGRDDRGRCEPPRREVRIWIGGYYENRIERVYHEGYWVEERKPAVYERRIVVVCDPCSGRRWEEERVVLIEPERVIRRFIPGWWEERIVRVWVPGRWVIRIS